LLATPSSGPGIGPFRGRLARKQRAQVYGLVARDAVIQDAIYRTVMKC
jgi:hypothetical protein